MTRWGMWTAEGDKRTRGMWKFSPREEERWPASMSHSWGRGVGGRVRRNGNPVGQGPIDFISLVIPFFPDEDQPCMNGWTVHVFMPRFPLPGCWFCWGAMEETDFSVLNICSSWNKTGLWVFIVALGMASWEASSWTEVSLSWCTSIWGKSFPPLFPQSSQSGPGTARTQSGGFLSP